jgi:transketolase
MSLTRQAVPTLRGGEKENLCARGGYVLSHANAERKVTIIATGSEVSLAIEAQAQLQKDGIPVAVVSMPCIELFEEQDATYRARVLGTAPRIVIEAGIRQGWDRYLGDKDVFIGMNGFGASAPAEILYEHFGITVAAAVAAAKKLCKSLYIKISG